MADPQPPKVFISYSQDSDGHADRVLALADALCDGGIDVILDRYVHPAPEQGWPRWMDQSIEAAQFVLLVCTETYRRRAMGLEEPGRGLGVKFEGNLIYNAICHRIEHDQRIGSRFIPILFPGS
ncbi:MAG TPA: SEFIR domain-containing protein, partial [Isosphaeraceae bacterium]|nr:SEFIR domain-containing protein [Isosphaeraceae bacterium]